MFEDDLLERALNKGDTLTLEDIEANQLFGSLRVGELTPDEIDLIDTYFSRNYRQGQLLEIPDECYTDWKDWKDKTLIELGFLSTKRNPYGAIYNGNRQSIINQRKYRPRINLREEERENGVGVPLESAHLGFKFWLQERIELAAAGKGSPRMLQVMEGKLDEKDAATSKWAELSEKIREELEKDFFNETTLEQRTQKSDSRAPILALNIFNKVEKYKHDKEQEKAAKKAERKGIRFSPSPNPTRLPTQSLCREIVRSLFSNVLAKVPTDEKILEGMTIPKLKAVFDEMGVSEDYDKDKTKRENIDNLLTIIRLGVELPKKQVGQEGWVRLSLTSQSFMLKLADRLSDLILYDWIPAVTNLSESEIKELNLNKSQTIEIKHLRKEKYFGRRGEPTNPTTAKEREDKTLYNVKRLTRSILFELVSKEIVSQRPMKYEEWIDHTDEKQKDKKKFGSYSNILLFSEKLKNWTGKSDFSSFKNKQEHAIYRWFKGEGDRFMYAPPQDHALSPSGKPDAGGYLTKTAKKQYIITNHSDYERFNHPRCKVSNLTIESLNKLQKVQWEINLDLLLTIFRLELGDKPRPNITEHSEIDKRITRIECRHWAEEAFYSRTNLDRNLERDISLMWARKIINHNANVFWHAWVCDWRGRLYSRGEGLSPQGDDFDKAIIRFKRWKPLGEVGRHWFFVHIHNLVAGLELEDWKNDPPLKSQSFKDRDDWVERNKEILVKIAKEPQEHRELLELDQHSGAKSTTFQRLAALIELRRVLSKIDEGADWDSVTSGLPVYLDASCNGYQHVSALLRNRELAEHVNVVKKPDPKAEERGDLYQAISDKAKKLCIPGNGLYDELFQLLTTTSAKIMVDKMGEFQLTKGPLFFSMTKDDRFYFANYRDSKKLIDSICSRAMAKQPTMTRMYGKIDTRNSFSGREGKGKPGFFSYVKINDNEYQCAKCDFTRKTARSVEKHATEESHWAAKWHQDSPLYKALLGPKSDKKFHALFPDEKQNKITELVDELFSEADKEVTKNAYNDYKESTREVAKFGVIGRRVRDIKSAKEKKREPNKGHYMFNGQEYGPNDLIKLPEYKYVVRWKLPDDFEVIHYYIKHVEASAGKAGNPTSNLSIYRHILPEWYDPDSTKRKESILKRLEKLGVKELDSFRKEMKYERKLIKFLKDKLKQKEATNNAIKIREVLRVLEIPSIHLPRYESDEKGRLRKYKQRSAIPPNLIHSLDAYHLRWTVKQMPDNCDLWVVHDAFGTHPGDLSRLRKNITQGFYDLHSKRDINDWLEAMITEDMYKEIFNQNPDKKKQYVKEEHLLALLKENNVELDTISSTRKGGGKPTKKDLITKLLQENIKPPQNWVAEIDPNKMDKSLVADIKKSIFLVD